MSNKFVIVVSQPTFCVVLNQSGGYPDSDDELEDEDGDHPGAEGITAHGCNAINCTHSYSHIHTQKYAERKIRTHIN